MVNNACYFQIGFFKICYCCPLLFHSIVNKGIYLFYNFVTYYNFTYD
jgi:hypothetical protein